jgi:hypothetical protein
MQGPRRRRSRGKRVKTHCAPAAWGDPPISAPPHHRARRSSTSGLRRNHFRQVARQLVTQAILNSNISRCPRSGSPTIAQCGQTPSTFPPESVRGPGDQPPLSQQAHRGAVVSVALVTRRRRSASRDRQILHGDWARTSGRRQPLALTIIYIGNRYICHGRDPMMHLDLSLLEGRHGALASAGKCSRRAVGRRQQPLAAPTLRAQLGHVSAEPRRRREGLLRRQVLPARFRRRWFDRVPGDASRRQSRKDVGSLCASVAHHRLRRSGAGEEAGLSAPPRPDDQPDNYTAPIDLSDVRS